MGRLHQMQMSFSPEEDRLFFRFNTTDKHEFRFWFTRRYVKLMWGDLEKLLLKQTQTVYNANPKAQKAMLSFQHETAVKKSDFSTKYAQEEMEMPLGETPILLSRFQVKTSEKGDSILCFHPEKGNGIELNVDKQLLHSFTKLLISGLNKTGWDLDYQITEPISSPQNVRLN